MGDEQLAELRRQQLNDMLQSGRTAALLSMLGVTVAVAVFREVLSMPVIWLSPAMVVFASTVTLVLARRWRDPFDTGRDTGIRLNVVALLNGLSGVGWGLLLYTGFDGAAGHADSIAMYALLFAVLFSLILSVMTLYSSYLPAIIAFTLPVLAGGVSFGASYDDRTLLLTAIVFTVISLALAVVARSRYAHYREFVILKTNNEKLLRAYREQKEIAESSSRAKSRFLAAASHDLRQPIHAIGLLSDTLESQAGQPHIKVLSQSITESVND
ncbi:MAG: histidine kinase dimerization/phospho-acceptor domain-containing protein, partial [Pseudomonadota bacterium]